LHDRTYVIAEMACSHEGSPAIARRIIDGAAAAGADAIQFQIWTAADMVVPRHPDYPLLRRLELSRADWSALHRHVRAAYPHLHVVACVYEARSVEFCETLPVDAYKIHSADLSNPDLLRQVAATGRRIDLSVGASTLDEIAKAIATIRAVGDSPIWLMYGLQSFPTSPADARLAFMNKLAGLFDLPVGYQDHSDAETPSAFFLPAAALGMGVSILEKHITIDRSAKGADYQAALHPDEFTRFVAMVREIEAAAGDGTPAPFSAAEDRYRLYSKKSIVAAHDLAEGTTLAASDILFMRAQEFGLPPDQAQRLLGRKTCRAVCAFEILLEKDFAQGASS
jgi:N,N'-diacetyllegionaminate synthase